ncbi:MAG TPA: hypothetical protein VMA31_05785 [Bryobacteraceae bacterium]|nr:hypothetical protein [Bryobacteraceae bacterium]
MKRVWMAVFLMAAAGASGAAKREADLVIYMSAPAEDPAMVGLAEGEARKILAGVGITVDWRMGKPDYEGPAKVILVVVRGSDDPNFKPGALAFTTVGTGAGALIQVFGGRIHCGMARAQEPPILAHVLVHEITHILEGVDRHSAHGIMKAHWNVEDFRRMAYSYLDFAPEDLRMIHTWTERHRATLVAAAR